MLDWTITEDDTPDARTPSPPPGRGQRRWAWLIIALASIGALAIWALTARHSDEREARVADLLARHPLPAPLPALIPIDAPQVEALNGDANGAVTITAVYAFTGVDGTALRFRAQRRFSAEGELLPSPAAVTSTIESGHLRVIVDANGPEAATAALTAELARVVAEACAPWSCPADLVLVVDLTQPTLATPVAPETDVTQPANRLFAYARTFVVLRDTLALPHPLTSGVPVDEATAGYWRRALADAALVQLALLVRDRAQPGFFAPPLAHNAFFYALVLRQATRSGVEDPAWLSATAAAHGVDAGALWRAQSAIDHAPPSDESELRAALGVLNSLMGDDLAFEHRLFATLRPERALDSWLAEAAATTGRSAEDTLRTLTDPPVLDVLASLADPSTMPTWSALITCSDGQWIWSPEGAQQPFGFSNAALAPVRVVGARSTTAGLDLALSIGGRIALRSAHTGRVDWTAGAQVPSAMGFAGWIGENAAYYWSAPDQNGTDIELVAPDRPGHILTRIVDAYQLAPAPVGDAAFVVSTAFSEWSLLDGSGLLRAVLPLNGLDIPFGVGYPPAWAPDGQRAAVLLGPGSGTAWGAGSSVGVLPAVTQPDFGVEIWSPERVDRQPAAGPNAGQVLWSPRSDRIAIAARVYDPGSNADEYALWLVSPEAQSAVPDNALRLDLPSDATMITDLGFSADGRILTATAWRLGRPTAYAFSTEDGALLLKQASTARVVWSPIGTSLLTLGAEGAAYRAQIADAPRPIAGLRCVGALWNPRTAP